MWRMWSLSARYTTKGLFIKFWCRLSGLQLYNPLQMIYKKLLQLRQSNHNTWCYIYMVEVLHSANVENIWKTDLNVDALENFKSGFKFFFKSIFWILAKWNIEKHPILRTHLLFKITLAAGQYLTIKTDAKTYSVKFRVIFHRLAIETGRHQKTPSSIESRVCIHIPGELVGDDLYLITIWKYHDVKRKRLDKIALSYNVRFWKFK